jgi:hypothetical protein
MARSVGFQEVDETSVEFQMDELSSEDLLELKKTLKVKNPWRGACYMHNDKATG